MDNRQDWITFEDIAGVKHLINRHMLAQLSPNGLTGKNAATVVIVGSGIHDIQVALTPEEILEKIYNIDSHHL